jgi:lipopolysaccharide export LptBFGC system permease protein LptF
MKSKYKYVLFGASGLLVLGLVFLLGLRTFVISIANQRTCEWANIDNIEINAKINIPSIIDSDCVYLESINTKKAYFEFNLADFDVDHYIEVNKFKNLESKHTEFDFINFNIDSLTIDMLYYKSKKGKKSNSYALFDKNKGILWVSIQYFDY